MYGKTERTQARHLKKALHLQSCYSFFTSRDFNTAIHAILRKGIPLFFSRYSVRLLGLENYPYSMKAFSKPSHQMSVRKALMKTGKPPEIICSYRYCKAWCTTNCTTWPRKNYGFAANRKVRSFEDHARHQRRILGRQTTVQFDGYPWILKRVGSSLEWRDPAYHVLQGPADLLRSLVARLSVKLHLRSLGPGKRWKGWFFTTNSHEVNWQPTVIANNTIEIPLSKTGHAVNLRPRHPKHLNKCGCQTPGTTLALLKMVGLKERSIYESPQSFAAQSYDLRGSGLAILGRPFPRRAVGALQK